MSEKTEIYNFLVHVSVFHGICEWTTRLSSEGLGNESLSDNLWLRNGKKSSISDGNF
jgi:hypothetical protein